MINDYFDTIYFADLVSLLPLNYTIIMSIYYPLSVYSYVPELFNIRYISGYGSILIISELLKKLIYPFTPLARRPEGACNCDLISKNGDVSGKPGLPSTHMAVISYFAVYNLMLLNNYNITKNKHIFILLNILLIILTGWARYIKKCHSIFQIVSGTILGSIYSFFVYNF